MTEQERYRYRPKANQPDSTSTPERSCQIHLVRHVRNHSQRKSLRQPNQLLRCANAVVQMLSDRRACPTTCQRQDEAQ